MINLWDMIRDSGVVGWLTCFIGIIGAGIMIERAYVLYFKFGMNVEEFFLKAQSLVLARKFDEALVLASGLQGKPLANAFKTILEKADRDDDAIFQAHDIAMSENVPLFTKRIHYLSMLANVATLMGLLGTIVGLILSFRAVGAADPSEKQALLANGISVSMYTTALGLAVSIPVMVFYSFLVARQNQLVEQMTEKCGKLTEMLTGSHIPSLSRQTVFPDAMNKDQMVSKNTPPPNIKAG
jgi:biopolymer transport protein ExbB/TolQ